MTVTIAHDSPDWSNRLSLSDEILFDGTVGRGVPLTQTAVFPTPRLSGLHIKTAALIGHMKIFVDWFADAAGAQQLTRQTIHVRNGVDFDQVIPVLGPFVRFVFTDTTVADTMDLLVNTTGFVGLVSLDHNQRRLQDANLINIGAGITSTQTSFVTRVGWAVLQFLSEAATFTVVVSAVTFDNVATVMYRFDEGGGRSQSHLISVPAQPTRIAVTNNTGAAADFSWYMHMIGAQYGGGG